MHELICPNCKKTFKIDGTIYDKIVAQIRNREFEKTLNDRIAHFEREKISELKLKEKEMENSLIHLRRKG